MTRQRCAVAGSPPGAASPERLREFGVGGCPPGVGRVASVAHQGFAGRGGSRGVEAESSESCPHCARRAAILRVVEGLQSKPPTGAQRAATGAIVRGIRGCGCQTGASSARQDLELPTLSRGNTTSLPDRAEAPRRAVSPGCAEVPRRAAEAVPLRPIEVPFARAESQP
jgi:hypothetical protein